VQKTSAAGETENVRRYLSILEVEAAPPSLDLLKDLVRAQIQRVPFENISKLYLKKTRGAVFIPTLEEHLDGIGRHGFGGTCYANNPYFAWLLRGLGFDVDLCGAEMSRPDVHVVSIVHLEGREYLVDVGYSAPFFEPMRRDLDNDLEIAWGRSRYVLQPQNGQRRSRMDLYRDNELVHGYTVNPIPREIGHFDEVIRESYSGEATFMNVLVVERFFAGHSLRFHNFDLIESSEDGSSAKTLADRDDLADAVSLHCGIPVDLVREAISGLDLEGDIYT
jgi:arylamine N-acetyltransferase